MDNSRVPPIYSLAVFHTLPQEAVKEGKSFVLGLGGPHLGPDGLNLLVGRDASDVADVHSRDGQYPSYWVCFSGPGFYRGLHNVLHSLHCGGE